MYNRLQTMPDVGGSLFHTLRERDTTYYGWLKYETLAGAELPDLPGLPVFQAKPVYCQFAARAGNTYPGC
jgi:hypothetical protein